MEPGPSLGEVHGQSAQVERRPDGGPAPADVVVEVPVQRLEGAVQVGGEGDEQDPGVQLGEPETYRESLQPGDRDGIRVLRHGGVRLRLGPQQMTYGLVGEVQPAQRIARRGIGGTAVRDQLGDAVAQSGEADEERVGRGGGVRGHCCCSPVSDAGVGCRGRWLRSCEPSRRAVHAAYTDHALRDRGADVVLGEGREGRGDHEVEGRFEFAAQRGPDLGQGTGLGVQPRHRERDGQAQRAERAREFVGGQELARQHRGQYRGEQPVLVLGLFGPGGDQVGQPEPAGWLAAAYDDVALVADGHLAALAPGDVLPDVVQVGVDGGRVAPGRPVAGRGLEGDLDARTGQRAAPQQPLEDLVHLVDHRRAPAPSAPSCACTSIVPSARPVPAGAPGTPTGQTVVPKRPCVSACSIRCSLHEGHMPRRAPGCGGADGW